ncbi:MAG TPA: hypothetical protein VFT59_04300 [Candidatus Saccharimonadales bacterium]|nr:hypothetical protein [Candidatus Saccharimonadales bacterium]
MKYANRQIGSAHAAIVVVLVLALLGALGVVFYQNFIAKDAAIPTADQQSETVKEEQKVKPERIAFESKIYAIDVPEGWSVVREESAEGPNTLTIQNPDKTIRTKFSVSSGGVGGACDPNSPLKVRFYNVSNKPVTTLGNFSSYLVEAVTDAEGGGYDYKIGMTQDGGETHAAVGDSHCTVAYVGIASRLVVDTESSTVTQPTIIATIDFPKLAAGTDVRVREIQQVKDMIAMEDYKKAVKILESARKE